MGLHGRDKYYIMGAHFFFHDFLIGLGVVGVHQKRAGQHVHGLIVKVFVDGYLAVGTHSEQSQTVFRVGGGGLKPI